MEEPITTLKQAFVRWAGEPCREVKRLPASGSERTYWRLTGTKKSAIGAFHPVTEENRAFIGLTSVFRRHGLNVPEVFYASRDTKAYLIQDLGDTTLFSLLDAGSETPYKTSVTEWFEKALAELVRFQAIAIKKFDERLFYPRKTFDRQSLIWDLNYFKYDFLKLVTVFNEQRLEDDFQRLMDFLLQAPGDHFMYRDFQSRNIMIHQDTLYFIDYQGGRMGPLQYDPVSLLFQVKAGMPQDVRETLLDSYLDVLKETTGVERPEFMKFYDGFILLRLLQVLGAYGFRGMIQRKSHFITSIPYALKELRGFLENHPLPVRLDELSNVLQRVTELERFQPVKNKEVDNLIVKVCSFSYKNGVPEDPAGHGGGFVFDCRALPNPGREESMRQLTGKDEIISNYLDSNHEVSAFLENVYDLIGQATGNYIDRGFRALSVSFGCTGGQHRSVFCAEKLAAYLHHQFPDITVELIHRELSDRK